MTSTVPDLTAAADVLNRAADRLEELVKEAPAGPWAVSDANEGRAAGPGKPDRGGHPMTETSVDPADLITDDDLDAVREMVDRGAGLDVALYEHAPAWRARWVAEALEDAAGEWNPDVLDDSGRSIAGTLRELAAEYRDGAR